MDQPAVSGHTVSSTRPSALVVPSVCHVDMETRGHTETHGRTETRGHTETRAHTHTHTHTHTHPPDTEIRGYNDRDVGTERHGTQRHTDRVTERHEDTEAHRQGHTETHRQGHRETRGDRDTQTGSQRNTGTQRHTDRDTQRHGDMRRQGNPPSFPSALLVLETHVMLIHFVVLLFVLVLKWNRGDGVRCSVRGCLP